VFIGIFQWRWELFSFTLTLFMVLITHGYTNGMFPSIYLSGNENYALFKSLIITVFFFYQQNHPWNENSNALTVNAFFLLWYTFPQWNHKWNENSKALVINAFSYCWLFTLLPTEPPMKWKVICNIWRGFWNFSCELKISIWLHRQIHRHKFSRYKYLIFYQ